MNKFIAAMTVLLFPVLAFAQQEVVVVDAEQPASEEILFWAVRMVFIIVGALAAWVAVKALKYFEAKSSIDVPKHFEDMLFSFAEKGVAIAEERAYRIAKTTSVKLSGNEKMEVALDFARDLAKEHGLDKISETKLKNYIDAKLGLDRTVTPVVP